MGKVPAIRLVDADEQKDEASPPFQFKQRYRFSIDKRGKEILGHLAPESCPVMFPRVFGARLIRHLPEAAQRFLKFAIREGADLRFRGVEVTTRGEVRVKPSAWARSFVHFVTCHPFKGSISEYRRWFVRGYEALLVNADGSVLSQGSSRFLGLIKVAKVSEEQLLQSMLGRFAAELIIFNPACLLLPYPYVHWEAGSDSNEATVTLAFGTKSVEARLIIASTGELQCVTVQRYCSIAGVQAVRWSATHSFGHYTTTSSGFHLPTCMTWSWRLFRGEPQPTSKIFARGKTLNVGPRDDLDGPGAGDSVQDLLDFDNNDFTGTRFDYARVHHATFTHLEYA